MRTRSRLLPQLSLGITANYTANPYLLLTRYNLPQVTSESHRSRALFSSIFARSVTIRRVDRADERGDRDSQGDDRVGDGDKPEELNNAIIVVDQPDHGGYRVPYLHPPRAWLESNRSSA